MPNVDDPDRAGPTDFRAQLVEFLSQAEELVNWTANNRDSGVSRYMRASLGAAWPATQARFGALRNEILSGSLDSGLEARGLTGPELAMKLTAFHAYFESWNALRRHHGGNRSRTEGEDVSSSSQS
jgi:hypothetical protein